MLISHFSLLQFQPRILHGQIQLSPFFAPLRNDDFTFSATNCGKIRLHSLCIFNFLGNTNLPRSPTMLSIPLLQIAFQHVRTVFRLRTLKKQFDAIQQNTAAVGQSHQNTATSLTGKSENVSICATADNGHIVTPQLRKRLQPIPTGGRLFKLQSLRMRFHLFCQTGFQVRSLTFQHKYCLFDPLTVFFPCHRSATNAQAFSQLIPQARAFFTKIPWELSGTSWQAEGLCQ